MSFARAISIDKVKQQNEQLENMKKTFVWFVSVEMEKSSIMYKLPKMAYSIHWRWPNESENVNVRENVRVTKMFHIYQKTKNQWKEAFFLLLFLFSFLYSFRLLYQLKMLLTFSMVCCSLYFYIYNNNNMVFKLWGAWFFTATFFFLHLSLLFIIIVTDPCGLKMTQNLNIKASQFHSTSSQSFDYEQNSKVMMIIDSQL